MAIILRVVGESAEEQVIRPNASRIVTSVQDTHPSRGSEPQKSFIRNTMGCSRFLVLASSSQISHIQTGFFLHTIPAAITHGLQNSETARPSAWALGPYAFPRGYHLSTAFHLLAAAAASGFAVPAPAARPAAPGSAPSTAAHLAPSDLPALAASATAARRLPACRRLELRQPMMPCPGAPPPAPSAAPMPVIGAAWPIGESGGVIAGAARPPTSSPAVGAVAAYCSAAAAVEIAISAWAMRFLCWSSAR